MVQHDVPSIAGESAEPIDQGVTTGDERERSPQTTSSIVMVEPALFRLNFQTAIDNSYQERPGNMTEEEARSLATLPRTEAFALHPGLQERTEHLDRETHAKAVEEFSAMVELLRKSLIEVTLIKDVAGHDSPDSIFPNNPISLHAEGNGTAIKYPMRHSSRRPEKNLPITKTLIEQIHSGIEQIIDLSTLEGKGHFVEGTGSMVLDRAAKIAYASFSERTTPRGVAKFAGIMNYEPITFRSFDSIHGTEIYHANVVMSVGDKFAVICSEAITDDTERQRVLDSLKATGKDIIEITTEQMNGFAGNILEVRNTAGNPLIVMSETARQNFTHEQLAKLSEYGEIVAASIPTIEKHGGGSARCMMLENHLPKQETH